MTNSPSKPIYPSWKCIPLFELCTKRCQKSLGNRQRQDKSKDKGCRRCLPLLSLLTSQSLGSRQWCASSAFRCMFWGYRYQGNKIIATISVSLFICVTARGEQFVSRSHGRGQGEGWQRGELGGFGDDSIDCRGGAGCFLALMLIQLCTLVSWMPF